MQRLLEIPQEVYDFLRNFRLRAGDLNREGGSKTAPFTHPLPGMPTPLAKILILQQALFLLVGFQPPMLVSRNSERTAVPCSSKNTKYVSWM